MPVQWNVPLPNNLWDIQDVNRYNKLPVWMAKQQSEKIPFWQRWQKKYGTLKWKPNMGSTLQGILAEHSPIANQIMAPRNITETPLKTIVSHFERSNQATIKLHRFESNQFHFLPSFQDFRDDQLQFASDDLNRQVGISYDLFVRWQVFQQSPYVYLVGNPAPYTAVAFGEATDVVSPKGTPEIIAMINGIGAGNGGYLDFRNICAVRQYMRHTVQAPPWEGMKANPGENQTVKGKFMLTGDPELYEALTFDEHVLNTRDLPRDLLNSEIQGIISGNIAFLAERYPLRIAEDGTFPQPEIEELLPPLTYGSNYRYETRPNPAYVAATVGVAFFEGQQAYESLEVGPPPKEFQGKGINESKFNALQWNGEVRLTNDLLVNYGNGNLDTNKYGTYLQLICECTLGIIANTNRFCLPILYRRNLTPSLNVP